MIEKSKKIQINPSTAEPKATRKWSNEYETFVVIPPDGGWGWVVVFGAFFSYFLSDGLQYSFGIFLKDLSEAFQCSESKVSLAGAINTCLFCISSPFSAALINRFGYRTVSFSGSVLAAIACLSTSFSNSIYMVIVFHGVFAGLGFGMIYLTAVIAVGFYFERWRAFATGIAVCGAGFGGICLPPMFTFLLAKIGWRHTFKVLSGMSLCIIIFSSVFRPIKSTRVMVTTERGNQTTRGTADRKISTVTIVEPKRMMVHSSELLINTIYATNSGGGGGETSGENNEKLKQRKRHGCTNRWVCWCKRNEDKVPVIRPLNKDDIFYSGSVVNLPEYKKSSQSSKLESKSRSNLEYQLSITRDSPQETSTKQEQQKNQCCKTTNRTIAKMLDYKLFKSQKFLLLVLNCVFMSLGFYTPFIFIKNAAVLRGINPNVAYWFISTMGLANIFGRVTCGLMSTIPGVRAIVVVYCLLMIAGISTLLSTVCYKTWVLFFYSAVYGFSIASMSALKTVIIVDMLGLDNLTNAIGMILLFQGMANFIGISVAGYLRDTTGDYRWSFYFGGTCICIAASFLFFMNMLECRNNR